MSLPKALCIVSCSLQSGTSWRGRSRTSPVLLRECAQTELRASTGEGECLPYWPVVTARLAYAIQRGADYGLPCFWILILVGGDGPTSTNLYSFYFRLLGKDRGPLGVSVWRPLLSGYCLAEDSLPLCCGLLYCCVGVTLLWALG